LAPESRPCRHRCLRGPHRPVHGYHARQCWVGFTWNQPRQDIECNRWKVAVKAGRFRGARVVAGDWTARLPPDQWSVRRTRCPVGDRFALRWPAEHGRSWACSGDASRTFARCGLRANDRSLWCGRSVAWFRSRSLDAAGAAVRSCGACSMIAGHGVRSDRTCPGLGWCGYRANDRWLWVSPCRSPVPDHGSASDRGARCAMRRARCSVGIAGVRAVASGRRGAGARRSVGCRWVRPTLGGSPLDRLAFQVAAGHQRSWACCATRPALWSVRSWAFRRRR
jgi:hypothetical protein